MNLFNYKKVDLLMKVFYFVREIHLLLVRLCLEGNNAYAIQLLLTIAVAFGVITGHLYNIYTVLQNSYVSKETINNIIFNSGVWIIYYTTKICMISCASNSCADNVEINNLQ